jgi:hypothetical protein
MKLSIPVPFHTVEDLAAKWGKTRDEVLSYAEVGVLAITELTLALADPDGLEILRRTMAEEAQ